MGESLKGTSKLDIHEEMNLLERKLAELQAMNVDENTITCAMKDYGMERFINFNFNYYFFGTNHQFLFYYIGLNENEVLRSFYFKNQFFIPLFYFFWNFNQPYHLLDIFFL